MKVNIIIPQDRSHNLAAQLVATWFAQVNAEIIRRYPHIQPTVTLGDVAAVQTLREGGEDHPTEADIRSLVDEVWDAIHST